MQNRTKKIAFYATPDLEEELEKLSEENSLSKSEIARRGTLIEMRRLRGSDICDE